MGAVIGLVAALGAACMGAALARAMADAFPGAGLISKDVSVGERDPDPHPVSWFSGRVRLRRRRRALDREVPQFLDLLASAAAGGLAAPLAAERAAAELRGPLALELAAAIERVSLGHRWRDELLATSERLDLPDLRRAVVALTRSEKLGVSLAESTEQLAAEVQAARRAHAEERARKAPVKMLFPLVSMVLPAFLLLTVVPVLVSTLGSM